MPSTPMRSLLISAMTLILCVGCGKAEGPELASVSGTVTLDGKPLPQVNIQFVPEAGGSPSFGGTDAHGKYKLLFTQDRAGAMLGKHRVEIAVPEPEVGEDSKPRNPSETAGVPQQFRPQTAKVKSGNNTIDFPLDSKKDSAANAPQQQRAPARREQGC